MSARRRAMTASLLVVWSMGTGLRAQRPSAIPPRSPRQLDCTFTVSARVAWNLAGPVVQVRREPVLQFRIGNIDVATGSADFILGALSTPMLVIRAGTQLHFVQAPEGGETAITSVNMAAGATRLQASYSRTAYYAYTGPGFTSVPQAEQYYGDCVAVP